MEGMMLHAGGWTATRDQVAAVPTPPATATFQPIAHLGLLDTIVKVARDFGLRVRNETLALAKDGQRFFGVLDMEGPAVDGEGLNLGIIMRNSHGKDLSALIGAGFRVWMCDNLAASADQIRFRKHTKDVWRDLQSWLWFEAMEKIVASHARTQVLAEQMRGRELSDKYADHLVVEMARRGIIAPGEVLPVLKEYAEPEIATWSKEPHNLWRLYNATTQHAKAYAPPVQLERTRKLTALATELVAV